MTTNGEKTTKIPRKFIWKSNQHLKQTQRVYGDEMASNTQVDGDDGDER